VNVKVGDVLTCRHGRIDNGTKWTVTKVGRKWFSAKRDDVHGYDTQFSLEDGYEKSDYSYYRRRLVDDELAAHLDRVAAAQQTLQSWGLQFRNYGVKEADLLLVAERLGVKP